MFNVGYHAGSGVKISPPASSPVQSLTNNQKYSLPPSTPAGTQVNVTDGFSFTGSGAPTTGDYIPNGTENGSVRYLNTVIDEFDGQCRCYFNVSGDGYWTFAIEGGDLIQASDIGGDNPWSVSWPGGATTTNPLPQQLNDPSTVVGGMFAVTPDSSFTFIYSKQVDQINVKDAYKKLGMSSGGPFTNAISWSDFGPGTRWNITDVSDTPVYYSIQDVSQPSDVTLWQDATTNLPVVLTVSLIPQGDLDAGCYPDGAGSAEANGPYQVNGSSVGFKTYLKIGGTENNLIQNGNPTSCVIGGEGGDLYTSAGAEAFPYQRTFTAADGTPPPPSTVVIDYLTDENNWVPVTP